MSPTGQSCMFCAKRGFASCSHPNQDVAYCDAFEDITLWYSHQVKLLERSLRHILVGASVIAGVLLLAIGGDLFLHLHLHGVVMDQLNRIPMHGGS